MLVERIQASLRWVVLKTASLLSPRTVIDGIEVIDVAEVDGAGTLDGLRAALSVIADRDPRRFGRLRQDLRRIMLVKAGGPEYASEFDACILRSGYVREGTPAAVATTIVHEAAHARLCRAGIGYGAGIRARVEAACVKEQIAFAERLGDQDILDHLRKKLDEQWWEPSQLRARRVAALRALGVPRCIVDRCWGRARPRTNQIAHSPPAPKP